MRTPVAKQPDGRVPPQFPAKRAVVTPHVFRTEQLPPSECGSASLALSESRPNLSDAHTSVAMVGNGTNEGPDTPKAHASNEAWAPCKRKEPTAGRRA